MKTYSIFLILIFQFETCAAALIFLKDKKYNRYSLTQPEAFLSPRALARRAKQKISLTNQDLPVSLVYLTILRRTGAKIIYTSRWLNAVWLEADSINLERIKKLEFVVPVEQSNHPISKQNLPLSTSTRRQPKPDGTTTTQLQSLDIDRMHSKGYLGQNIHIAIFDGGFRTVNHAQPLQHLFKDKHLQDTFNFVANTSQVFQYDEHGSQILTILAARNSDKLKGIVPLAKYSLYITESIVEENPCEELYWLLAAERADSLGVDIISSSLGYNTFDNETADYKQSELDGKTALVTQAALWASRRGILVVNSAGNMEGSWTKILPPADADSILAVGAVDGKGKLTYFSCLGPTADQRIKPDVVALGLHVLALDSHGELVRTTGTSFATPLITGLAAGLWQTYPHLTNIQIIAALKVSGDNAKPNNEIGWGTPSYSRACRLIEE